MRGLIILIATISLLVGLTSNGVAQKKPTGFLVPDKYITVLLVPDPQSPLQISGPIKVIRTDKGLLLCYTIQNVSNTNIKNFVIKETNWFGSEGDTVPFDKNHNQPFVPWGSESRLPPEEDIDDAPLELLKAQQWGIAPTRNRVFIAMVVKVKFSDGTTYDVSKKYGELRKFLDGLELVGLSTNDENGEQVAKEEKLRSFVSDLMTSNNP